MKTVQNKTSEKPSGAQPSADKIRHGAVVWQRVMGSVPVSLTTAVLLLAVIAGLVSAMVNEMTIRAGLLQQP